jgi:5-hydroxyisourate hydrolase
MSKISTHVLDVSLGKPAAGIAVVLETRKHDASWSILGQGTTDKDGRVPSLLSNGKLNAGTYRLVFETAAYLSKGKNPFFPQVSVVFNIEDASQHYHIPLLLSPYGYSTYRGS